MVDDMICIIWRTCSGAGTCLALKHDVFALYIAVYEHRTNDTWHSLKTSSLTWSNACTLVTVQIRQAYSAKRSPVLVYFLGYPATYVRESPKSLLFVPRARHLHLFNLHFSRCDLSLVLLHDIAVKHSNNCTELALIGAIIVHTRGFASSGFGTAAQALHNGTISSMASRCRRYMGDH